MPLLVCGAGAVVAPRIDRTSRRWLFVVAFVELCDTQAGVWAALWERSGGQNLARPRAAAARACVHGLQEG